MPPPTGVSLIELTVIITILAIMAVIAIPRWYGTSIQYTHELDKLSHIIELAQYTAINRGVPSYITLTEHSYQAFVQMPGGDQPLVPLTEIAEPFTLAATTARIEFQASTGLPLHPYTITIMAQQSYAVTIDQFGELLITPLAETL